MAPRKTSTASALASASAPASAPAPVETKPVEVSAPVAEAPAVEAPVKKARKPRVDKTVENPVIVHAIQESLAKEARVVEQVSRFVDYPIPSDGLYHSANRVKTSFLYPLKRDIVGHRDAISHAKKAGTNEFPQATVDYLKNATDSYLAERKCSYENTVVSSLKKDKELAKKLRDALEDGTVLSVKSDFYDGLATFRNALDGKTTCEIAEFLLQRDNVRISSTAHYTLTAFVDVVMVSLISGSVSKAREQTSDKGCTLDVSHIRSAIESGQPLLSGFLRTLKVSEDDPSDSASDETAADSDDTDETKLPSFASYVRTIARDVYKQTGDSRKLSLKLGFRRVCTDLINELVGRVSSVVDAQRDEYPRTIKTSRLRSTLEALTRFVGETEWPAISKKMDDAIAVYVA